mmetsp:Transcript_42844/g.50241  ORF Transcript_42844/g.50241 Transcript_42844/m.50241 type:complete len:200 (-) Transcript_42844:153-752(-)|eukprot:CAMPEP_0168337664 /NCGR_PEP_ID=MMETSP0213-20121227/12334_1 /TAXON_ID=151035 /ORGANISM="Euplotes harpa, Strain FSP1.4" /LENGTH=199 /DNA_ID=CAMNT_0008343215 /DNA_START=8 /DNA_END=607 /DNA_ORIENTATION=+
MSEEFEFKEEGPLKFDQKPTPVGEPEKQYQSSKEMKEIMEVSKLAFERAKEHNPEDDKMRENLFRSDTGIFYPGKSSGQPYKRNYYRYCYNIMKRSGKLRTKAGDLFDNFIAQADKGINYYEPKFGESNPYNPLSLEASFNIMILDDEKFIKAKSDASLKGIPVDDILVTEGCMGDDLTMLGGKAGFLSHFCTFFHFNA